MSPFLLPEPAARADARELLLDYLDGYRAVVAAKAGGLTGAQLRTSVLASGWTPAELLVHLAAMERRWLVWGFAGQDVPDPWRDDREGRWWADPGRSLAELVVDLEAGGRRTREIASAAALEELAATGGRFEHGSAPPTLLAILLHVLQEYARHAGHLDVVRELVDGRTGE
jgi:hypothetical protein